MSAIGAQFPVSWGGPLTLRGAASFCLNFAPRPEVVDGIWQRPEWPWKTLPASEFCRGWRRLQPISEEAGKRYTGFMLQTLGLPLPGDYGQVPAKLWYCTKCNAQKLCVNLKMIPRYDPVIYIMCCDIMR